MLTGVHGDFGEPAARQPSGSDQLVQRVVDESLKRQTELTWRYSAAFSLGRLTRA
jgi:hypothetical protein